MKKAILKTTLLLLLTLYCSTMTAQDYSFKDYSWDDKNIATAIPENYKNENEVILNRNTKIEIIQVGEQVKQYFLFHNKVYINSDDAIERNNRIYIPMGKDEVIVMNKARVILKNGKIINLNNKDIKEEIDEEKGVKYNYFAVNGLEKGAIVERMYILEESPELDGKTYKLQDKYPILNLTFELIYPEYVIFKTKSYNGLSEPVLDTQKLPKKTVLTITEKNIAALDDDEKYSNWDVQLKMFRYKLDENLNTRSKNIYNFKKFATNVFERFNVELDKKQQKTVDDFCKSIPKSNETQEQIWNIENKIKKTITYNRFIDTKESLSEVIKTKQANQSDILKLYIAIFKNFQIENNMVFTSDRFKIPFDKEFESYENLNEILFYFPTIQKYLTPLEVDFRIPLFPFGLANNNGLFIKPKMFAGVAMGVGEVNFIEIPTAEITHDVMDITVDFSKDIENPSITTQISFGGYSAINFQPIKDFVSSDQYQNILKDVAKNYTIETEYKSLTSENDGLESIGKKPYVLKIAFDGKDLIQKAGDNYLFSIGKIIGTQVELYQQNKRVMPIEINYPHSYLRKIKVVLPKGSTVKNLEKLTMDFKTQINGKTEAAFTSKYNKQENEILVENTEFYNIVNYPLDKFDDYIAVINAAADFNKIVIIVNK